MSRIFSPFVTIPLICIAIFAIILTKNNQPKEITPIEKHGSSTMPRARQDTPEKFEPSSRSKREKHPISHIESNQKITQKPEAYSEEFWGNHLLRVQNDDDLNDREIGNQLIMIASNPKAPEWARAEAMLNALVFTDDENYDQDIKPLAIRMDLPDSVHDVILEDLLNRPHPTALPVARLIANTNGHQLADVMDEYVNSHE